MFLTPSDFIGKYELHKGMYDTAKLQIYINKYEIRYLKSLLGVDLYNQFIADLSPNPPLPRSPNFQKIFYAFAEDVNYNMLDSDGMLEMLKGFIYFEYSKDNFMQQTTYGGVQQTAENSKVLTSLQTMIYARYNEAIRTYNAIQGYLIINFNQPTGQLVQLGVVSTGTGYTAFAGIVSPITMSKSVAFFSQLTGGTGYTAGTNATSGGTGTGLSLTIFVNGAGTILSANMGVAGTGYTVGDVVSVLGGTGGTFTITQVYPASDGIGGVLNVNAHNVGGVGQKTLTTGGTGYSNGTINGVTTTGGTGAGCTVNLTVALGIVTAITIDTEGSGYTIGNVLTANFGGGTGCTFTVTTVWNGETYDVLIDTNNRGKYYKVGDMLGFPKPTLNGDARYSVAYAGKGDYSLFKGLRKATAYWI